MGADDRKSLGQYFTPSTVAAFALDALRLFAPDLNSQRVIDPACGPGVFLRAAMSGGIPAPSLWGCDTDSRMQAEWRASGLGAAGAHLYTYDGLLNHDPDVLAGAFDVVIGNPPFHSEILAGRTSAELSELASRLHLWRRQPEGRGLGGELTAAQARAFSRFPSELLFLERFCELCATGGGVAIILPEGVCANRRWQHVRTWLLLRMTIYGILGLPRHTFRQGSTAAKTCLLIMRKQPPQARHRIMMADVEDITPGPHGELGAVLEAWKNGLEIGTAQPWLPVPGRE